MPRSGGLYYAAAVLAPSGWGPTAAWFTGWSNWLGQVTGAPSVDYALAAMVLAACAIANPAFTPTNLETFLLAVLLMVVHGLISSLPTLWIARLNSYGSTLNLLALVVVLVLIPLTAQSVPRFNAASSVWSIQNYTEWPDGVAVSMSFVAIIWTMSGTLLPSL
jgi:amino acid transporter